MPSLFTTDQTLRSVAARLVLVMMGTLLSAMALVTMTAADAEALELDSVISVFCDGTGFEDWTGAEGPGGPTPDGVSDPGDDLVTCETPAGNGDVIEPEDNLIAIGSGGPFAQSAARALMDNTDLDARTIVEKGLAIAGDICIHTNHNQTIEQLDF